MNREKINDFLGAYSRALNLPQETTDILQELLPKMINKYSQHTPTVSEKQDDYNRYIIKPVNGEYSIEDFFLNRLMRSVLRFTTSYEPKDKEKGGFLDGTCLIDLNEWSIERQIDVNLPPNTPGFNDMKRVARKKVIMHEFEHAMQTQYNKDTDIDKIYKKVYRKIIDEILRIGNGKYRSVIRTADEIERATVNDSLNVTLKHNGLKVKNHVSKSYMENTNEIFNESEALEMVGARVQDYRMFPDGSYFPRRNVESSNRNITNYADLLKILIGEKNAFAGMYLDPLKMFEIFNKRYGDIFQEQFGNEKDAWFNLVNQINKIKKSNSQDDHLILQNVLARCFDKKIEHDMQSGQITPGDVAKMKADLLTFKNSMLWHKDKSVRAGFEHVQILDSIRKKVEQLEQNISVQPENKLPDENISTDVSEKQSVEPSVDKSQITDVENEGKNKFIKSFIQAYDDTETDFQYETRVNDEEFNMTRVKDMIDSKGLNRMLIMDLDGDMPDVSQGENAGFRYSQKQVSAMVRLLKAAQLLTDNKTLNPTGRNFLQEFTDLPSINDKLKQMKSALKDKDSYMFELKANAETNRTNGTLPQFPKTSGEFDALGILVARETPVMGTGSNVALPINGVKNDVKRSMITISEVTQAQSEIAERNQRNVLLAKAESNELSGEEKQKLDRLNAKYSDVPRDIGEEK